MCKNEYTDPVLYPSARWKDLRLSTPTPPPANTGTALDVRAELIERLRLELVGPNDPFELLDESPGQRYLCGILWPCDSPIEPGDDEGSEVQEDSTLAESTPTLAQTLKPSSIGLSFVVRSGVDRLQARVTWGTYSLTSTEQVAGPDGSVQQRSHWQRQDHQLPEIELFLEPDGRRRSAPLLSDPLFQIEWLARPIPSGLAVSLFLVNRAEPPARGSQDPHCIFQPVVQLRGPEGVDYPFAHRALETAPDAYRDPDVQADELLFHEHRVFAVGHGAATDWQGLSEDHQFASTLQTVITPVFEVPLVSPRGWAGEGTLDMQALADAADGEAINESLAPLLDAYECWLFGDPSRPDRPSLEKTAATLEGDLQRTALDHLEQCRQSLNRMRKGLELIVQDPIVCQAFQFANRAMALQRRQALWAREARRASNWSIPRTAVPCVWRPFQIAFVLQALTGVVQPDHPDRQICDLLWFPTGGGKTEAYLGLAAFTMALRRLRQPEDPAFRGDAGITVLMRYTLRLLTIQQFQRATTLICACELIRQKDVATWGHEPFRTGLWVGGDSTPNNFDEAKRLLDTEDPTSRATPVQLVACPWCASPLKKNHYYADARKRRVIITCSRRECEFFKKQNPEGIPAVVEDEEIYRLLPTLLIGTVDKFARLPWLGETQALFGQVTGFVSGWGFCAAGEDPAGDARRRESLARQQLPDIPADTRRLLPPELIIQDELHLISGPLGTMVGLYETAIDWLASRPLAAGKVGPKVVASTATIRRADRQVLALFARRVAVFPSPGTRAGSSFFGEEQAVSAQPGRSYLGVFAPGRSVKTALVRVYAALLASHAAINSPASARDPYQTLVCYFNSLRELGGALRLLEDDVNGRMKVLETRRAGQRYRYQLRSLPGEIPELTSRVDSRKIPNILDQLERRSDAAGEQPPDVVLASNMIQVGVDIPRLGLMVVTGQPKTTAEYIQATSRVGREHPGLVITVYNWARPRDLSHYERFRSYHAALYRYVEASSVTPFSSRARDRALAAAMVAMLRLSSDMLAPRDSAFRFRPARPEAAEVLNAVIQRAVETEGPSRQQEVRSQAQMYLGRWTTAAGRNGLVYSGGQRQTPRLLYSLGGRPTGEFPAPNSMRDVEPAVGIYLDEELNQNG